MRGKAAGAIAPLTQAWITPAHAGKSKPKSFLFFLGRDHPRTCGEKYGYESVQRAMCGSPPHMRGKVRLSNSGEKIIGITPAHAGKRLTATHSNLGYKDHPRTCGEKTLFAVLFHHRLGSPPHMRGKEPYRLREGLFPRITPAHAGKRCVPTRKCFM